MKAALTEAGYFDDYQPKKLLILGDLFDRGKEARKIQRFISELMNKDEVILIRGNHEDLYEDLVTVDDGMPYSHHVSNGTYDTAQQLAIYDEMDAYDLASAGRNTVYYKRLLPSMLNYYETEHYIFVHGWIPCICDKSTFSNTSDWREASDDMWKQARWVNGMQAYHTVYDNNKTIVCGHWHASFGHAQIEHSGSEFGDDADFHPFFGDGIIALDACTAVSGFVNCIVIED